MIEISVTQNEKISVIYSHAKNLACSLAQMNAESATVKVIINFTGTVYTNHTVFTADKLGIVTESTWIE